MTKPAHVCEQVDMTMDIVPNPPVAGQPLTVFGEAVASSGPAPTGNVTVFVSRDPASYTPCDIQYATHCMQIEHMQALRVELEASLGAHI